MAEGENHDDHYHDDQVRQGDIYGVERIRVFRCNNPQDDGMESYFDGLFFFNVHKTVHTGRPGTSSESVQQFHPELKVVPFMQEALCVLDDDVDDWFEFVEDIIRASRLFERSDQLARDISGYLKSFFRFRSGEFDSIVIVVDVVRLKFTREYLEGKDMVVAVDDDDDDDFVMDSDDDDDEGVDDDMEKIVRFARRCWGEEGRDMELVEVHARRMTLRVSIV